MKSLFATLTMMALIAASLPAFADRSFIITEAQDGISAMQCWHGTEQRAQSKALNAGYAYCANNLGGSPEENYEVMQSYCGSGSTPVTVCPHVCFAKIKTYCNN